MIRLVMADDHGLMREGLRRLFNSIDDIKVVGEAESGDAVVDVIKSSDIDILLLDLTMPGLCGLGLVKEIRAITRKLPILVLSMHDEVYTVLSVIGAGVNGYITKQTTDPNQLLTAIRTVAKGGRYLPAEMAERLVFESINEPQPMHKQLSKREQEIFLLLAKGDCVKDIAEKLEICDKTVSTHKHNLMRKMGFTSNAEIVRYAVESKL